MVMSGGGFQSFNSFPLVSVFIDHDECLLYNLPVASRGPIIGQKKKLKLEFEIK